MERRRDKLGRYLPVDSPPITLELPAECFADAAQKFREVHADPATLDYARKTIKVLKAQKGYRPEDLYVMGWIDGTRYALIQIDGMPKNALEAAVRAAFQKKPG